MSWTNVEMDETDELGPAIRTLDDPRALMALRRIDHHLGVAEKAVTRLRASIAALLMEDTGETTEARREVLRLPQAIASAYDALDEAWMIAAELGFRSPDE